MAVAAMDVQQMTDADGLVSDELEPAHAAGRRPTVAVAGRVALSLAAVLVVRRTIAALRRR